MYARLIAFTVALLVALPALAGDIAVHEAWARSSIGKLPNSAAYLHVMNMGKTDDRLVAAASSAAERAEIHEHIMENNIARMREVSGGIAVPAGGMAELKPGGYHIMLLGLKAPLREGTEIDLTLTFEKAGKVAVKVPVKKGTAQMDHGKMDHGSGHKH